MKIWFFFPFLHFGASFVTRNCMDCFDAVGDHDIIIVKNIGFLVKIFFWDFFPLLLSAKNIMSDFVSFVVC